MHSMRRELRRLLGGLYWVDPQPACAGALRELRPPHDSADFEWRERADPDGAWGALAQGSSASGRLHPSDG